MRQSRYLVLVISFFFLVACGGGGGTSTSGGSSSALSVLITDDLSTDYAKVWVTVSRVAASGPDGSEVVLYEDPQGGVFNLTELDGVAALLDTASLDPGVYGDFRITLADEITLTDRTGQSITAAFNGTGQTETLAVAGSVSVPEAGNISVGFDFDLKQFVYDPATGLVDPVIIMVEQEGLERLDRTYGEIEGRVASIIDTATFELRTRSGTITVGLQATATVTDESRGFVGSDTGALSIGQEVEVYGNYDASTLTLSAVQVRIDDDGDGVSSFGRAEVEGMVQSFDGTTLVLDVREADFVPATTTLTISNVPNAFFTRGALADLGAGQWIEVEGNWEDPVFTALRIEIEGGRPNRSDDDTDAGYMDDYAEVKGTVQGISGDTITLTLTSFDHFAPITDSIEVDAGSAWYKYGNSDCLEVGAFIEAKGAITSTGLSATVIELESACAAGSGSPVDDDGDGPAEVRGTVQEVNGESLTLHIVRAEHIVTDATGITVDISGAWYEYGSPADLTPGALVEVKGAWDGSVLEAYKVEFE